MRHVRTSGFSDDHCVRRFANEFDVAAFPFEKEHEAIAFSRLSVVFDEGSADADVEDECVLTIEESEDRLRKPEALKFAPVVCHHLSGSIHWRPGGGKYIAAPEMSLW